MNHFLVKAITSTLLLAFVQIYLYAQPGFGRSQKINGDWKFALSDIPQAKEGSFDDRQWEKVQLPHDWSIKGKLDSTLASCTGYLPGGIGWYRKYINIPGSQSGKRVYLYFEGVYNRSQAYINGQLLGSRPNGYISFMYDATPYLKFGEDNVISVRVDHSRSADSRWYTGSGIYRNVWLVYADPIHIAQWGVFAYPKLEKNLYSLNVQTELKNNTNKDENIEVLHEIFSPEGRSVAKYRQKIIVPKSQGRTSSATIPVSSPKLWSLESPSRYKLVTRVIQNGRLLDGTTTSTGFRTFSFNPDTGFALNGKNVKMKGVCLHHDAGVLGAAVPGEVWRKRLMKLKQIGGNAIRTTHNPQSSDLYRLCDELGLLVLNEAFDEWEYPKRKWLEGWNVGKPGLQGNFDFFEEWGVRDLGDMVRRDRNHLSIFAWSIGNEVDYPNDPYSHPILDGDGGFTQKAFGGFKKGAPDANRLGEIAAKLVPVVKRYDPSRAVTAGLAGVAMSNETAYPGLLDIAGYNYTENRYAGDHKKYPNRILYGSENRHDLKAWKAVVDNDYIFGQFLWTGIDYLGESGRWPSRGFYSGLLDFAGSMKPRGYFRQSLWSSNPMVYLGTYSIDQNTGIVSEDVLSQGESKKKKAKAGLSMDAWSQWNYRKGELIRVVCYTNTAKAQLVLNNMPLGETKPYDPATGIIYWDIPFEAGKLEVLGMDHNGKEITRYAVNTADDAYKINILSGNDQAITEDGVVQIDLQITDKEGIPVTDAEDLITCRIDGHATLLGLEAGNNADMGDYTDNRQNAYKGKLTAYVRLHPQSGSAKVSFTAKGLVQADVNIRNHR